MSATVFIDDPWSKQCRNNRDLASGPTDKVGDVDDLSIVPRYPLWHNSFQIARTTRR